MENQMLFIEYCKRKGACQESLVWIENRSFSQAWEDCDNPCWLLWSIAKFGNLNEYERLAKLIIATKLVSSIAQTMVDINNRFYPSGKANGMKNICDFIRNNINVEVKQTLFQKFV